MKLNIWMITAVMSCILSGVSFAQDKPTLKNVTVEEFKSMLGSKDFTLVDVHIPEERHLQATDEFIPYDKIKENLDKLPDKNAKIVVYCRSGRMSEEAGTELVSLGYTDVYNVLGGFIDMKKAGIPIDGPDRIIYLTAKKFAFDPDTIVLKVNDKVKIIAKSLDVTHGFSLNEFSINQTIIAGERTVIEFTVNKKGNFDFTCSVFCGSGHSHMRGKITVQ